MRYLNQKNKANSYINYDFIEVIRCKNSTVNIFHKQEDQ